MRPAGAFRLAAPRQRRGQLHRRRLPCQRPLARRSLRLRHGRHRGLRHSLATSALSLQENAVRHANGKIVEVIFSTLLRLQEKSVSINEFKLSVW